MRELKAMFAARACDWDALATEDVYWRTHSQTPCPVCGHGLLFHEPLTKVCDVCHAPGG